MKVFFFFKALLWILILHGVFLKKANIVTPFLIGTFILASTYVIIHFSGKIKPLRDIGKLKFNYRIVKIATFCLAVFLLCSVMKIREDLSIEFE
jgi:hypothetical protein